jgi:hypothetical protein
MHSIVVSLEYPADADSDFFIKGSNRSCQTMLLNPVPSSIYFHSSQGFRTPMSLLALLLSSLLFFSGFAAAGIYAPDCSLSWEWTFNTLGQNACTVAAFMMSTCSGGSFTINALPGPSYSYSGPSGSDDTDLCKCNTIAYSLLSACDACQGAEWISWAEYKYNCTTVLVPSEFPNPVPAGTSVPLWALIDVTVC